VAKNSADNCMFCGEAPCVCNAPKKKATPKRAAKKVAPASVEPQSDPTKAQPSMIAQRKALAASKKAIKTGPIKPMAKAKQSTDAQLEEFELTRVLRMFDFHGMLSQEDKRKHAARLRQPQPSPEVQGILKRVRNTSEGGEKDDA
jgi:hypothetical protein